jgi:hypothetical protein
MAKLLEQNFKDLTRWNRAGLKRFQYIDGNAAIYLELLRQALKEQFAGELNVAPPGYGEVPQDESETDRQERILGQYLTEPDDMLWAMLRTFSRSCHVLTETINAAANESSLGTATEWDNLRRLVEMLDYHPQPPASAYTRLFLRAKEQSSGLVETGFQVKYSPPEGGTPVVFETLEDVEIDAGLNELRLAGWNRCPAPFNPFSSKTENPEWPLEAEEKDLNVGQLAVLLEKSADERYPDRIAADAVTLARVEADYLTLARSPDASLLNPLKGDTELLALAKAIKTPRLNGDDVYVLDRETTLTSGDLIAWRQAGQWYFDIVAETERDTLLPVFCQGDLQGMLYQAVAINPVTADDGAAEYRLPLDTLAAVYITDRGEISEVMTPDAAHTHFIPETVIVDGSARPMYFRLRAEPSISADSIYIVRSDQEAMARVTEQGHCANVFDFDGGPGGLGSGEWLVAEGENDMDANVRRAVRVISVEEFEDYFRLTLAPPINAGWASPVSAGGSVFNRFPAQLRRVEVLLDQAVFNEVRLRELTSGRIARRPASAIQGIRDVFSDWLGRLGVESISDLANLEINAARYTSAMSVGITQRELRESKARAETLLALEWRQDSLNALLDLTLGELAGMSDEDVILRASQMRAGTWRLGLSRLLRIHGPFKKTFYPSAYDYNPTPLVPAAATVRELPLAAPPPGVLKANATLLLEQQPYQAMYCESQREVLVERVDADLRQVILTAAIPADAGFTLGNTVIRGNLVMAGHGESKPTRVLGSGDATAANQSFLLDVENVSFIADPTLANGVRADIRIAVEGVTWEQTSTLRDSAPADPHYVVYMTEDGKLKIRFGDGVNGRRLPTGANNIRISYRQGVGSKGNLSAARLDKPVKPHRLVERVEQKTPSSAGADMEAADSMRKNAPSTVLALERAVSVNDFAMLARSHSAISQARAFRGQTGLGRREHVKIVVVPAAGSLLTEGFRDKLITFVSAHSLPGVTVSVEAYQPVILLFDITLKINSQAHDPETVRNEVATALKNAFDPGQRELGQAFYRAELYQVVEGITGVENSDCKLLAPEIGAEYIEPLPAEGEVIRLIQPRTNAMAHLAAGDTLIDKIKIEEYLP